VVDPHGALDRVLSRTVSGSTGASTTYYVYGLGLIGEETNGAYTAYHFDTRGSTVALTDINANVTDSFSYGPYGELNNHTGSSTTPFQYNGQFGVQTDPNGLLYMRARYYNPAIKRFINQDVLLGNINPGISLNRFAYANADPISSMDPFGLCAQSDEAAETNVSLSAGQNRASQPNSLQNFGNISTGQARISIPIPPITMTGELKVDTDGGRTTNTFGDPIL
jgi:RHS repeat-associated protein